MSSTSVTCEQFEIRSEVEVVHIPTGAVFWAYPYSNPSDFVQNMKVSWGREPPQEAYAEQIRLTATQLLLDLKDVKSRQRPAFFA